MTRLLRPHVPLEVRCRVALRQLGEMFPDAVIEAARTKPGDAYLKGIGVFVPRAGFKSLLTERLARLADLLACKPEDLQLDHDPALENRQQFKNGRGEIVRYVPAANNPEHLVYRERRAHQIKTNVRGDGAQYADNVLAKRERKRLKNKANKRSCGKYSWPSRPLRGGSEWPKRGVRKIGRA